MEYGLLCESGIESARTKSHGEKGGEIIIEGDCLKYRMKSKTGTDYNFPRIARHLEENIGSVKISRLIFENTIDNVVFRQEIKVCDIAEQLKNVAGEEYKNKRCVFTVRDGKPQKKEDSIFKEYTEILQKLSDWGKMI